MHLCGSLGRIVLRQHKKIFLDFKILHIWYKNYLSISVDIEISQLCKHFNFQAQPSVNSDIGFSVNHIKNPALILQKRESEGKRENVFLHNYVLRQFFLWLEQTNFVRVFNNIIFYLHIIIFINILNPPSYERQITKKKLILTSEY